jgi:heme/copper-type cytochrome/quinol oxidase subunit 3
MSSSSTALEEMHHIEPQIQVGRARAAVIMFILSDILSILALFAAGGYLSGLNVLNQYKVPGDHPPAFVPGLVVAIILVISAAAYYGWERGARKDEQGGQRIIFILALLLMLVAAVVQFWMGATLGYAGNPFHAYESVIMLLTWYSAVHLALAAIIGLLLLGRILRGRLAGRGYIAEVVGYWWYYTVIAGLLMWLFSLLLR